MRYHVSLRSHLIQMKSSLILALMCSIVPVFLYYEHGVESLGFAIKASFIMYFLVAIPHSIIYYKYWTLSNGKKLSINLKSKEFCFVENDIISKFNRNDIERIETTISKAKSNRNARWYPWDSYCYSIIYLKSGERYLITSLMLPEISWPIKLPMENIKSTYLCWV